MRGRNRLLAASGLCGVAMLAGGCVTQQEYDTLFEANRSLESQNASLRSSLTACEGERDALLTSGGDTSSAISSMRSENDRLRGQLRDALASIEKLEDRLGSLAVGGLDPTTDLALSRLASMHPNLVIYDADRGMLRFASDLTFATGSDAVQESAKSTLVQLAQILKTPEASRYDVVIVGHTDSQPIGPKTAPRHPTNMHLSAHRAISVRRVLGGEGVAFERMQAAGWGEFRPIVPNSSNGQTPANRRVEIYLVPSTLDQAAKGTTTPSEPAPSAAPSGEPAPRWDPVK